MFLFALIKWGRRQRQASQLQYYSYNTKLLNYILSFGVHHLPESLLCGYIKNLAGMAELSEIVVFDKGLAWFISMAWRLGHSAIGEIGDLSMGPLWPGRCYRLCEVAQTMDPGCQNGDSRL